jgi:phosphoribosyl-ATP pyrophosphohydrolase
MPDTTTNVLADLAQSIRAKRNASPEHSYTAQLLSQGIEKCAKKLGEEAVETALASMTGDKRHIASESADLLYHLLVLLEATGVEFGDVLAELARRQGIGGLAEKASRRKD